MNPSIIVAGYCGYFSHNLTRWGQRHMPPMNLHPAICRTDDTEWVALNNVPMGVV